MAGLMLADVRWGATAAASALKDHRATCYECTGQGGRRARCSELAELSAVLESWRWELRHWFDPGPGQGVLT